MPLPILTKIDDRNHFAELLKTNPGILIIKFGATWCGPCKMIEPDVKFYMSKMPDNVQCVVVDVDECIDIYSFLSSKKMVRGVPAILCYYKENLNYVPDDIIIGANKMQVKALFENCYKKSITMT